MNKKGFINNFFTPELLSIVKKSTASLILLLLVLFMSLIAIGTGNGALKYVEDRMNDAFITFLDVKIPGRYGVSIQNEWKYKLKEDAKFYNYSDPESFQIEFFELSSLSKTNNAEMFKVVSYKETNEFVKLLLDSKENRLVAPNTDIVPFKNHSWGCVITQSAIKRLRVDSVNNYSQISHVLFSPDQSQPDNQVVIPVLAIVDDLRNNADVLMPEDLFFALSLSSDFFLSEEDPFFKNTDDYLQYFINPDHCAECREELEGLGFEIIKKSDGDFAKKMQTHILDGFYMQKSYMDSLEFHQTLSSVKELDLKSEIIRVYDIEDRYSNSTLEDDVNKIIQNANPDIFTIFFKNNPNTKSQKNTPLENLENFVAHVDTSYLTKKTAVTSPIKIDKTVIEQKRNFEFFGILIKILSLALCLFSVISIIFFITNLLLSHIKNNKKNLGTLKAFGFSNGDIILTYSMITLCLILGSFLVSWTISELIGTQLVQSLFSSSSNSFLKEVKYENYAIWQLFLGLVILPALVITRQLFKFLNKVTPGDLIYERK